MASTQKLTVEQEDILVAAMLKAGVDRGTVEAALIEAQRMLDRPARPANVSVVQQASVVEAGATMIGYQADRIG